MSIVFPDTEKALFIPGPSGQLEAVAAPAKAEQPSEVAVVICHPHPLHGGTMNNKVVTTLFRTFRNMGLDVVRFNYRGVGKSEGEFDNTIGETDDLMTIIQWLKTQKPNHRLWLAGFSFGSFVAAKGVLRSDCEQLINIAPAVHHYAFNELDKMPCPWLVVQPDQDEVVPPQAVYDWAETVPDVELVTIPESSHFFHGKLIELRDVIIQALEDRL